MKRKVFVYMVNDIKTLIYKFGKSACGNNLHFSFTYSADICEFLLHLVHYKLAHSHLSIDKSCLHALLRGLADGSAGIVYFNARKLTRKEPPTRF